MKAQSPLLGFNNNVRHKGRVFHIQTEDSGIKHPHVITHLFADGGRIVRSQKTSYAEFVGDEELQRKVRTLMQEQHKAMFIALRAGKFDHLLETVPVTEPVPPPRPSQPQSVGRPPMESTVSIEIGNEGDPKSVVHLAPGQPIPQRPSVPSPEPSDRPAPASPTPAPPTAQSSPPPSEERKRPSPRPAALALTETAMQAAIPDVAPEIVVRPPTVPPASMEAGPDTEVVRERPAHMRVPTPEGGFALRSPSTGPEEPRRGRSPSQGLRRLTPPPPLPSSSMPGGVRPMDRPSGAPDRSAAPVAQERPAARPPSMIPPSAKPLSMPPVIGTGPTLPAVAAVAGPPPQPLPSPSPDAGRFPGPESKGITDAQRTVPRRNSGLLAALGALSSGAKAPSLGASPAAGRPHGSSLGVPPRIGGGGDRAPASAPREPARLDGEAKPGASSLDLDLQALERAAEQGNSPVYRQVRDFPAPPQALRNSAAHARSITPGGPTAAVPQPPPSQPSSPDRAGPASGNRYAPSRPAAIFGASRPQEGSSIFGEDLISEKSLDEVILSYLAEDLDAPKK